MLKRKAYEYLEQWKASPSKRALLITGARQIGKTYLVRQFAKENYENCVEINFILNPEAKTIFSKPLSTQDLLMRLSLIVGAPAKPGKTLFFFDEIQEAPEVLTSIKGLIDKGDYDFVLSGSLLGVELRDIRSNPVGYVTTKMMYPLDFEEFSWAAGVDAQVFSNLRHCFESEEEVDSFTHERLENLFRKYLVVGGMPDAVQTFVKTDNLAMVRDVQESIKDWYRADISKYCPNSDKLKAREAYDLVPSELNNPNKRFILKQLNENARFRNYEDAFLWLTRANVALAAYNVEEPVAPLLLSKSRNLFKLFYSDVGLLLSALSSKTSLEVLDDASGVNFGSIYESAVAQELIAHGFDLYYFNSKKRGEIDFIVESKDGEVTPIEVKSGKDYKRHNAINKIFDVEEYRLNNGYALAPCNIKREGRVLYLPVYMVSLLQND